MNLPGKRVPRMPFLQRRPPDGCRIDDRVGS